MNAATFKTEIKNHKEWLMGKTITMTLITPKGTRKYTFRTLKGFGKAVLAFEGLGAAFGFVKVGNEYIEKPAKDFNEFVNRIDNGVWTSVHFLATTLK